MNNREAFEAAVKECGNEEQFRNNMQLSLACYAYFIHGVNAAIASQAKQYHSEDALNMVQSQAQQESQALKALKGMIELWFRTRESGCLPIEVAHAQFVLKTLLPQSQAQQTESKPALKVVNGEICYKSTDDDQSYGMWCPVSYDTKHSYKEGTKFIVMPPAPEEDKS